MLRYLDTVIIPYVTATRQALNLPTSQPALTLFDVFAAHRCETVLHKLRSNNILYVFIPASCTGELQPLDLTVNKFLRKAKSLFFNMVFR